VCVSLRVEHLFCCCFLHFFKTRPLLVLHLLKALYKIFKMGDRKEGKMVQGEKSSFFREMTRNEWNFLPKKSGKLSKKITSHWWTVERRREETQTSNSLFFK
jgi:hypothetical protein